MTEPIGTLTWISGPVVRARVSGAASLSEQVFVGDERLVGEVIALEHDEAVVQVYEETLGLRPGEPIFGSGEPLSLALGPGLIGTVYDGIQRPLDRIREQQGIYIARGAQAQPLSKKKWTFLPRVREGDLIKEGAVLGAVQETPLIEHRILVPHGREGKLLRLAEQGDYSVEEPIADVETADGSVHPLKLAQRWPVRRERPAEKRLEPDRPLITGQRVLDTFAPLARGGTASLPGPFGTGKTILQHALVKWCDAQIIVYVGCGERGNEMAEVLQDFPKLTDPWSGRRLMERTILIANTSNMPVAAREASIYTGITIAEYYRDQGYHVALMADSTSRWAEALREIAGRLEQMPAEEGYPAYLPSRLAAFYERAGRVRTLAQSEGSITIIGAISPPGGDFTEPVTQHTQRFTRAFWALDRTLAGARHYPAINWQTAFSLYSDAVAGWWSEQTGQDWQEIRREATEILEQDARLENLVRLVGADALPDRQRWILVAARLLKEGFLQQSALHAVDAYCTPAKQMRLLKMFVELSDLGNTLIDAGVSLRRLQEALDFSRLIQLRENVPNEQDDQIETAWEEMKATLTALGPSARVEQ